MRKLLLTSSALVAAASISSYAVADVSVSGNFDWKYRNIASNQADNDGTSMAQDHEVVISFSNKTDTGLTVSGTYDMDAGAGTVDASFITVSGGFGSIAMGATDGVSDAFGIHEQDLINDETHLGRFSPTAFADSSTTTTTGIMTNAGEVSVSGDANKLAYITPAMGGFKAGYSIADAGVDTSSNDTTEVGLSYSMPMDAGSLLFEYNQVKRDATDTIEEIQATNMGVTATMGALSMIASSGQFEEASVGSTALTEDHEATGFAVKYDMGGGMTVAVSVMESEDSADVSGTTGAKEKYSSNIGEISYTIAPGLKANLTYNDFDYKKGGTSLDNEAGSITQLTIAASF
jgi:hypothetical protein